MFTLSAGAALIIVLLLILFPSVIVIGMLLFVLKNTSTITEINNRSAKTESMLSSLASNFQLNQVENSFNEILKSQNDINDIVENAPTLYRTADGKHTARSVEELLSKMSKDPQSGIDKSDWDALKRVFEQIIQQVDEIETDEEDEE